MSESQLLLQLQLHLDVILHLKRNWSERFLWLGADVIRLQSVSAITATGRCVGLVLVPVQDPGCLQ